MRMYCNNRFDWSLSDKALSPYIKQQKEKVVSGLAIPCKSEQEIFDKLKLPYIAPTQRDVIPSVFLQHTRH